MLENGAETSRVEDTMERMISKALGVERNQETFTYITLSGIFVRTDMNNTNFILRNRLRGFHGQGVP